MRCKVSFCRLKQAYIIVSLKCKHIWMAILISILTNLFTGVKRSDKIRTIKGKIVKRKEMEVAGQHNMC